MDVGTLITFGNLLRGILYVSMPGFAGVLPSISPVVLCSSSEDDLWDKFLVFISHRGRRKAKKNHDQINLSNLQPPTYRSIILHIGLYDLLPLCVGFFHIIIKYVWYKILIKIQTNCYTSAYATKPSTTSQTINLRRILFSTSVKSYY